MATQENGQMYSLAGEFRIKSELLRRNIQCYITYGNTKSTDIIIHSKNSNKYKKVEVKTTTITNEKKPNNFITSFYQKFKTEKQHSPDYWILFLQDLTVNEDRFFILTHFEMSLEQAKRNKSSDQPWDERAFRVIKGVDNVLIKDIIQYENKWNTIKV